MDPKTSPWQKRFGLTTCSAAEVATTVPPTALGIAVIYEQTEAGETIYLGVESRSGNLRDFCVRRLQTAKIPTGTQLMVAFKTMPLADKSPEAVSAVCREQVILAGEMRRELRPAMR